jgi:ectoine hydroxylase-related dioxygenase (phytanoyl-CoA dioxygenase family)
MNPIFNDSETEREFQRKGYVVQPFLGAREIQELSDVYQSLTTEQPPDYYVTAFSQSYDYRRKVHEGVKAVIKEKLKTVVPHYNICLSQFVGKTARSQRGKVWLHQDWSFVDNTVHPAVHFWIPLVDVDTHNGCLKVVMGSHTFFEHIRATPTNPAPFDPLKDLLDAEFTTSIPMRAGSILFYDGRLLHGSEENLSIHSRIAAQGILVTEGAVISG